MKNIIKNGNETNILFTTTLNANGYIDNCGKIFYREYKNRNVYKNYKTICCSRQCAGKFQWERRQNFSIAIEDKIKNNLIDIIEVPYTTSLNTSS